MGCDIWNPIVRSYRLPYIVEVKQSVLEGIVNSIMLTLLKVKMMKQSFITESVFYDHLQFISLWLDITICFDM